VRGRWRTATVAAATCAEANTASTAALVLGEQAVDWLDGHDVAARLVGTDGQVALVGGWPPDGQVA
jgi:thiamine biosynthesis lipoprotein